MYFLSGDQVSQSTVGTCAATPLLLSAPVAGSQSKARMPSAVPEPISTR